MDADADAPDGMGKNGLAADKRFSVYRNNVVVSLMEALADTFPSLLALLGETNFERISRAYVARNPPSMPMMQNYGDLFAEFAERLPALSEVPFVADLARLERAWLDAYHAIDAPAMTADALAGLSPEETLEIKLVPQPATRLIVSEHSIHDLFNCRFADVEPPEDWSHPQSVLLTRMDNTVTATMLPPGDTAFYAAMMGDEPLAAAIGAAMEADSTFNPAQAIAGALQSGAFTERADTNSRGEKAA